MRVAIVHYWLVGMRGGEKVVEQMCNAYPGADVYTHVVDRGRIAQSIADRVKGTSFISDLPFARRRYKWYLPLMPFALEQIDLRGYDLVLSSESGPAKGVIAPPDALHVCYCHSPMRYIWNMYHDYLESAGVPARIGLKIIAHYLRGWDASASMRVHRYVANSNCVAQRIKAYYNRDAAVIYPPVSTDAFAPAPPGDVGDFYLMVGEMVAYKRFDLAIEAFNRSGKKLLIVGGGEQYARLKSMAKANVSLLGPQGFDDLRRLYARCRALIFPGQEDFGIVPVEAMASGRPVIAFRRGGAMESVVEGQTGLFFDEQTVGSLNAAIDRSERFRWDPRKIVAHADRFGAERFVSEFRAYIDSCLEDRRRDVAAPGRHSRPVSLDSLMANDALEALERG